MHRTAITAPSTAVVPEVVPPSSSTPKGLPPEALELLERGVEAARSQGGWRAYLEAQSRFHAYSWRNTMLILQQKPGATRVAGYRAWLDLGRQVRRGEKGLLILAPVVKRELDPETGEVRSNVVGFKTVRVFDLAQTDGEPLPSRPQLELLEVESPRAHELATRLEAALEGWGTRVLLTAELPEGVLGCWNRTRDEVRLDPQLTGLQALATLVHEAAHSRLHRSGGSRPSELAEFEAESVAYVVCRHLGLDTAAFSFGYLASYGATAETIRAVGPRVQACAKELLEGLEDRPGHRESLASTAARAA